MARGSQKEWKTVDMFKDYTSTSFWENCKTSIYSMVNKGKYMSDGIYVLLIEWDCSGGATISRGSM